MCLKQIGAWFYVEVVTFMCSTRLTRNAVSLAKRLKDGQSIKLVLYEQMSAMEEARGLALADLDRLGESVASLGSEFVEQVQGRTIRAELLAIAL